MSLEDYITKYYSSQQEFADFMGVSRQQVWKWINTMTVVVENNKLISKNVLRELPDSTLQCFAKEKKK